MCQLQCYIARRRTNASQVHIVWVSFVLGVGIGVFSPSVGYFYNIQKILVSHYPSVDKYCAEPVPVVLVSTSYLDNQESYSAHIKPTRRAASISTFRVILRATDQSATPFEGSGSDRFAFSIKHEVKSHRLSVPGMKMRVFD